MRMENSLQKRLKLRMDMLSMNPTETAKKAGLGASFVRDILRGKTRSPSADNLEKLAKALNTTVDWFNGDAEMSRSSARNEKFEVNALAVKGIIQAGAWLDRSVIDDYDDDHETIPVARDPRFPHATQYGLMVHGDSMDKEYPDGSYVTCVDFVESGLGIRPGLTVHVERRNGHLVEVTLKVIEIIDGQMALSPRSSNPKHKPLLLDGDSGTEIVVCGVVTGSYRRTAI